ncbi:MarR family transcriptional regulator [Umezawaea sp. Da 62-37]|uniref:MarR family winged helix-turn-helix transcriptional regulator n=1 Tax=Umezawaea sp. Da 62-37 TaxID=3075927 RepID=UPI0028F6FC38|nr:MarR family transcriptional regulator [Umezawaea sp. Da 62-37]WNV89758.1 MarR family transcriptional regulator [Umezawaea sp. Da 62-37]
MRDAEKDRLVDQVVQAQKQLQRHVASTYSNPLLQVNLTMQQLKVLLMLSMGEARSSQELTRGLGVGPATVTGLVDRLAAQGLVGRREDPQDRRVRLVEPTESGRALVAKLEAAGTNHFRGLLETLDTEDLVALNRIVGRLTEAAEAEAGSAE